MVAVGTVMFLCWSWKSAHPEQGPHPKSCAHLGARQQLLGQEQAGVGHARTRKIPHLTSFGPVPQGQCDNWSHGGVQSHFSTPLRAGQGSSWPWSPFPSVRIRHLWKTRGRACGSHVDTSLWPWHWSKSTFSPRGQVLVSIAWVQSSSHPSTSQHLFLTVQGTLDSSRGHPAGLGWVQVHCTPHGSAVEHLWDPRNGDL
jgi:hypothetical protein